MRYGHPKRQLVDAIQFTGNFDDIESFVGGDAAFVNGKLLVATLQGPLWADPKDWIIKDAKGIFSACSPYIFGELYKQRSPRKDGLE